MQISSFAYAWHTSTPREFSQEDFRNSCISSIPLPSLRPPAREQIYYCTTRLQGWRLRVGVPLKILGWPVSQAISVCVRGEHLVVHADPRSQHTITKQHYLALPAAACHRCGLKNGEQVLIAVHINRSALLVFPQRFLDAMLAGLLTEPLSGP